MDWSKAIKLKDSKDFVEIDNHFKLIAGPGAGKTTFLINHINRILSLSEKLSKTRKVACITYTNTGVETIKGRLKETVDDVEVSTIHSFLYNHVVKPYLWLLKDCPFPVEKLDGHDDINPGYTIMDEFKKRSKQNWLQVNGELSSALKSITWVLDENEAPQLKRLNNNGVAIRKINYIYYKKICWERGLMSHDDVLYFSYLLLKESQEIRKILRAKFPYLLLDEFQDTNPIQVAIIKMIAEKETVVGVIGDPCQAIFSFQGTDKNMFEQFWLNNMKLYYLPNNHRSTQEIINLLNHMRSNEDFSQSSPEGKSGENPTLLIGSTRAAYKFVLKKLKDKEFYTLAYKNDVVNMIKYKFKHNKLEEFDLVSRDKERGRLIYYIIHAIEYGKQVKLKEAIKFMKQAYRKAENFTNKVAFANLKRLLNLYDQFCEDNIKDFYNKYIYGHYGIKGKISGGNIGEFYEQMFYKEIATNVNIIDDQSKYKTIHKSKGDEFDNVLVIIPKDKTSKVDEYLQFLTSPNMDEEDHRVYYVALSRAKEKLYINVPDISEKVLEKLKHLNINCIYLEESKEDVII